MSSKSYTLPGSDIEVICEYRISRLQDVTLGDCYIDGGEIDPSALFIKMPGTLNEALYVRDSKVISLAEYFQSKLDLDASDIINDEFDDAFLAEAAE